MRFSILPAFILLLPLGEIAGFVVVGRTIGLALTLALVMASFILGVVLLRRQGTGILRRMSSEGRNGVMPGRDLLKPGMTVIAALLLIIPGFLTDIIAVLILIPPVRDFIWRSIAKRFVVVNAKDSFSDGPKADFRDRNPNSKVVDLDEEDYHREPDRNSPWSGKHLGD
ncbi:FxsA family protein [Rhizobium etli]|uniref:FxsA family protein n=1 Tax=Rhizobium etli TaxID=29449 RepID=UPI000383901E|nr:FxsA cytoplasmic membrane protein [Rhizobium etli bv. mimosae str. Mim1]